MTYWRPRAAPHHPYLVFFSSSSVFRAGLTNALTRALHPLRRALPITAQQEEDRPEGSRDPSSFSVENEHVISG